MHLSEGFTLDFELTSARLSLNLIYLFPGSEAANVESVLVMRRPVLLRNWVSFGV